MNVETAMSRVPRVAFIAPRFHTNQAEVVRYLIGRGINVSFFVAGVGQSEVHQDVAPTLLEFVNHGFLRRWLKNFDDNPYFNLFRLGIPNVSSLRRLARQHPDLTIIRTPITVVGLVTALLLRWLGSKLVFYTQTPLYRDDRGIKDKLLNFYALAMGAVWITPCRGQTALGAPLANSFFLPFSAFPQCYEKRWFQDGRVAILMVGKFLPRKRHDLLLDALARLPDPSAFRVTLVGELSDVTGSKTMDALIERISQLNFEVDIRTNLSYEEVMKLYLSHDLFVLPSENESASVSNLEAMSYGLPVVVSSCNRTGDYAGDSGWVFRSQSLEDLALVLKDAISDREELKRRGAMAREIVEREFTPDRVFRPFFDMYLATERDGRAG